MPGTARATPQQEQQAAERVVQRVYYEGVPYEAARSVTAVGAERLVAMLFDPAERRYAANVVVTLGIAAHPGAFEAIETAAGAGASGEVDRSTYRLLDAVPFAMGHLARVDRRAFDWLAARAATRAADPGWSHGPFRGQALADQQRRRAIAGLALSGRPEAAAILASIETGPGIAARSVAADLELAATVAAARELRDRIAAVGADAALAADRAR